MLALAALALAGCETSAEKSAQLEKQAKLHQTHLSAQRAPLQSLAAGRTGSKARVTATTTLHSREGTAAVVTVRSLSPSALRNVPILISVTGSGGHTLYTNDVSGLAPSLTSIALLAPHASFSWIDDQIQGQQAPTGVTAKLGEGEPLGASGAQQLPVSGTVSEPGSEGGTVEGTVTNPSASSQHEVVVYAVARRATRTVAAGRAVLASLAGGASSHFQLFLIGNPSGATLSLVAQAAGG